MVDSNNLKYIARPQRKLIEPHNTPQDQGSPRKQSNLGKTMSLKYDYLLVLQKSAVSVIFMILFSHMVRSSLSSSRFIYQPNSLYQNEHQLYLHQYQPSSHTDAVLLFLQELIHLLPGASSAPIGKLSPRGISSMVAGIEWDPQDQFSMEMKDGFLIMGSLAFVLVNMLI